MAWNAPRAKDRINRFSDSIPEARVERFEDEFLPRRATERAKLVALGVKAEDTDPLYDLPDGAAILVQDAVHVYVNALAYNDVRREADGTETAASHARGLSYLHLLYTAADRAVEAVGAQRVDFAGGRMHAVIAEPAGAANLAERISRALALVKEFTDLAREGAGMFVRQQQFPLRFRAGLDLGTCVAMDSRRSDDREPVFIGPAANYAAKLADGDQEGIYMSDRVRAALGLATVGSFLAEEYSQVSDYEVLKAVRNYSGYDVAGTSKRLDRWAAEVRNNPAMVLQPAAFQFHEHQPPLKTIDYLKLTPSHSIRMRLVSIFADLDAYTAYIDHCVAAGCIGKAVRLLHILRCEFNAVLKEDFGGRKVRYIGDCMHGVIAAGRYGVDSAETIELAALCVGGIRSSFDLCRVMVEHADRLGLAIGFEFGATPISRIGIRGPRAVRVASSLATRASERLQRDCNGVETMIGTNAYEHAPAGIRKLFGPDHKAGGLVFDDVEASTRFTPAPATARATPAILTGVAAAAAATPSRAFSR
jgi:class 3 adenylate cyclase